MAEAENRICLLTEEPCIRITEDDWGFCGGDETFQGVCPNLVTAVVTAKESMQSKLVGEGRKLEPKRIDSKTVQINHISKGSGGNYPYRRVVSGKTVRPY